MNLSRLSGLSLVAIWSLSSACTADDDAASKQRMALMEREIQQLDATSSEIKPATALQFAAKPLLRYSDPTRGLAEANVLMDASVWRLGEQGRPTGIVTLEIYRADAASGVLSFEFLSLSPHKFAIRHEGVPSIVWDATESGLMLKPLPDAVKPAATPAGRLLQLRQFAKRFAVREKLMNNEIVECRLLSQPIDRYQSPSENIVDGALFAFANGTNPEVGIFFECDAERWMYGIARLTSAEATISFDGRDVASFPVAYTLRVRKGHYVSDSRPVELPR